MTSPIYILGINAFHADAAAVLLRDGEVVCAIAEERINRVKHYAGFPALAIRRCLEVAGIDITRVDHIAIGRDGTANLMQKLAFAARNLPNIGQLAKQRLENRAKVRDIPTLLAQACEVDRTKLRATVHGIEHHLCHAASAFFASDFEDSAILSVDGFGDFTSTMIARGTDDSIEVLDRVFFPHSLGILYTAVCQYIGYGGYGDEGKVMGLAPYGQPAVMDVMRDLVRERDNGKFELGLDYFVHHTEGVDYSFDEQGNPTVAPLFSKALVERLGPARQKGETVEQRHMDLARSLQARLEDLYFHILRDLHKRVGGDTLSIAGGVGLNSVANGKIFTQTPFRKLATHPASTDDGTAYGAALYVHTVTLGKGRPAPLRTAYLGDEYSDEEIRVALERAGITGARLVSDDELYTTTAKRIAAGEVVGWFQGRMEWGPRALGARSILAHPGHPGMKDILNSRIKHREWFRPFAPSILEERTGDYFTETWPSPHMMQVYDTKPEGRAHLTAVDHVDHTGRLQTVNEVEAPRYYRLIKAFERETGIPVVLNTSFNENEPIVHTPAEAIDCYARTRMDALAIGNWIVEKAQPAP